VSLQEYPLNKPCFIIAEVGMNHNGDLALAKESIEAAVGAFEAILDIKD